MVAARWMPSRSSPASTGNLTLLAIFADPDGNSLMLHHRYAPR